MRTCTFTTLLACGIAAGCSTAASDRSASGDGPAPAHNLSIAPDRPANLYFCMPANPRWQYVGAADPNARSRRGSRPTTANGAPLAPTLDFDVVANSVIYLRMDLGDTLGEPTAASATGSKHAVAIHLTPGRHYRLAWQASADPRKPRGELTDLASRVAVDAVAVPVHSCR